METLKSFLYFGNEEAVWGLDIVWVKVNKNEITPVRRRSMDARKIFPCPNSHYFTNPRPI